MKHRARINETSIKLNNLSEAIIKMNSQTEFLCLVGVSVALMGILLAKKKKKKPRKMWVNPYLQERSRKGRFFKDVSTASNILQASKK